MSAVDNSFIDFYLEINCRRDLSSSPGKCCCYERENAINRFCTQWFRLFYGHDWWPHNNNRLFLRCSKSSLNVSGVTLQHRILYGYKNFPAALSTFLDRSLFTVFSARSYNLIFASIALWPWPHIINPENLSGLSSAQQQHNNYPSCTGGPQILEIKNKSRKIPPSDASYTRSNDFSLWAFSLSPQTVSSTLVVVFLLGEYNRWQRVAFGACKWSKVRDKRAGTFPSEEKTKSDNLFQTYLVVLMNYNRLKLPFPVESLLLLYVRTK